MEKIKLPTAQECVHLINVTYKVPINIVNHSIKVNAVAVFLAEELKKKGLDINVALVDKASILHDMLKIVELHDLKQVFTPPGQNKEITVSKKDWMAWLELKKRYAGMSHEEAAAHVLKERYPELAEVIRKHGYHDQSGDKELATWEEKIVNYADKRVTHIAIVSLKERFEEGHKRYAKKNILSGIDKEYQKRADKRYFELEKEIFNKLDFGPEDVKKLVEDKIVEENTQTEDKGVDNNAG